MIGPVELACVVIENPRPGISLCWAEENVVWQILLWGMAVRALWSWSSVPLIEPEGSTGNSMVDGSPPKIPT